LFYQELSAFLSSRDCDLSGTTFTKVLEAANFEAIKGEKKEIYCWKNIDISIFVLFTVKMYMFTANCMISLPERKTCFKEICFHFSTLMAEKMTSNLILSRTAKFLQTTLCCIQNIPELKIRFNDESVELVDNYKHLGVAFASDGNLTVH
jgi:hypothetical protein